MPSTSHFLNASFGAIGFVWAYLFYRWFRDEPTEHPSVSEEERNLILADRQVDAQLLRGWPYWSRLLSQRNMILLCLNDWNFPLLLLSGLFAIGAVCWLFIDPRRAVFESGTEGEHTNPFVPRTNRPNA